MHPVSNQLNVFEKIARLVDIARSVLLYAELRHLVNELGIQETLLFGLGLRDPRLERIDCVLICWSIVRRICPSRSCQERSQNNDRQRPRDTHEEPPPWLRINANSLDSTD